MCETFAATASAPERRATNSFPRRPAVERTVDPTPPRNWVFRELRFQRIISELFPTVYGQWFLTVTCALLPSSR
jgi:hypothetical protein